MGRLTLASDVQAALSREGESVELTSADGRLVGYYLSPAEYRKLQYRIANALVTDAELEESRRMPGGRTTEEVIARITSQVAPKS